MSGVSESCFAAALLDSEKPVPDGLTSWNGDRPGRGFAIYRNNVASGLVRALAKRFPATERIVGAPFFAAMGQAFVRQHPPKSPLLFEYGDSFADFVEIFAPAAALAYLPDVIRLETARSWAYHAADETSIEPRTFATVPPDDLPGLRLKLHGSAFIIRSAHPVVTIWAANTGDDDAGPVEHWVAEEALVIRPLLTVSVHRLPLGGATFVEAIRAAPLGVAVEEALREEPASTSRPPSPVSCRLGFSRASHLDPVRRRHPVPPCRRRI